MMNGLVGAYERGTLIDLAFPVLLLEMVHVSVVAYTLTKPCNNIGV